MTSRIESSEGEAAFLPHHRQPITPPSRRGDSVTRANRSAAVACGRGGDGRREDNGFRRRGVLLIATPPERTDARSTPRGFKVRFAQSVKAILFSLGGVFILLYPSQFQS